MRSFPKWMRPIAALITAAFVVAIAVVAVPFAAEAAGGPTVTVNQAAGQADPTSSSPVLFDVEFSEPVTGFGGSDIILGGTAGPGGLAVIGSDGDSSYTVQVVGMSQSGTVTVDVAAGAATAVAAPNLPSEASTSTDNSVDFTTTSPVPTETINVAPSQAGATSTSPILYDVVFSAPVQGFTGAGVILSGSAHPTTAVVSGSGTTYTVAVSGMTQTGLVQATVTSGAATGVAAPNKPNTASTSTINSVLYYVPSDDPTVTVEQGAAQADPVAFSPVTFDVVFSEPVHGIIPTDIVLSGTAGALGAQLIDSGDHVHFTLLVSVINASGTVIADLAPGAAESIATGAPSAASTSTDNTVDFTYVPGPTVAIDPAAGQANPASTGPILFDVVFSEDVVGFVGDDVTVSGTAGATTATVTGSGSDYTVAVSGMTQDGTVIIDVSAASAQAVSSGSSNVADVSRDNEVDYAVAVPGAASSPAASDPSVLAFTGLDEPWVPWLGALLLIAGAAAIVTARRLGWWAKRSPAKD